MQAQPSSFPWLDPAFPMPNSLSGAEVSVRHFCVRKTSALVPICLVVVVSDTGAEVSWVRSVLGPKCLDTIISAIFLGILHLLLRSI